MTSAQDAALEPLRAALIAQARAEAQRLRGEAEADGRRVVVEAQRQAAQILAEAHTQGEADAAELITAERGKSRRAARAVVLAAQRAAYDDVQHKARAAVRALLAEPAGRERLEAAARARLGETAEVHALADGGLVAHTADGRRIEASVQLLVETALADLNLEQLWAR